MMFAQSSDLCIFDSTGTSDPPGVFSYSTDIGTFDGTAPIVFNIFFWGINKENGDPGIRLLTEEHCLASVSQLNRVYNEFGIFFKYYGMDNTSFNSGLYFHMTAGEAPGLFSYAEVEGYKKENSFNIYVASGGTSGFGGLAEGYYGLGVATHYGFYVSEHVMAHEIGHNFNLKHVHDNWYVGHLYPDTECEYYEDCEYCPEHVTRDTSNPDYNADKTGDYVIDTPAMPNFRKEWCAYESIPNSQCDSHFYEWVDPVTFIYNGPGDDCLGEPYFITSQDVKNYMAYTPAPPSLFFKKFTDGQKVRMLEAIASNSGSLAAARTTVASLFEPYSGEYYMSGPTLPIHKPLFQPGFDYKFVDCDCSCPQPIAYENINFTYNNANVISSFAADEDRYDAIMHPNHAAIRILQLETSLTQPRRCYDNTNRTPNGGSILRFNDGVFNANVTISTKDSLEINDTQLINELQPGLYNILEQYDDGGIQETVIYKENN